MLAVVIVGSVVSAPARILPLGDEFLVNANPEGSRRNPSVAGNTLGGFIVVWEEHLNVPPYFEIVGRLYDGSGMPVASQFQVTDEDRATDAARIGKQGARGAAG